MKVINKVNVGNLSEVYDILFDRLYFLACWYGVDKIGKLLLEKINDSPDFKSTFKWTEYIFTPALIKYETVDPLHFIGSISSHRADDSFRTNRINEMFKFLDIDIRYDVVKADYSNVFPYSVNLVSYRREEQSLSIWNWLAEMESGYIISKKHWDARWYNVRTMEKTLLFYMASPEEHLPLTKNMMILLSQFNIIGNRYTTNISYENYIKTLEKLNHFDDDIFKEMTILANMIKLGHLNGNIPDNIKILINKLAYIKAK